MAREFGMVLVGKEERHSDTNEYNTCRVRTWIIERCGKDLGKFAIEACNRTVLSTKRLGDNAFNELL